MRGHWQSHGLPWVLLFPLCLLQCLTTTPTLAFVTKHPPTSILQKNHHHDRTGSLLRFVSKEVDADPQSNSQQQQQPKTTITSIVLVAGFESFNRDLYTRAAEQHNNIDLQVFADSDIRRVKKSVSNENENDDTIINPDFAHAVRNADVFIGSLIFDYDDVLVIQKLLSQSSSIIEGPIILMFESATELMERNRVGTFSMAPKENSAPAGPPPIVKSILAAFGSDKEEDKLSGYLKLLKIGPTLLQFVPGETAADVRVWLEAYRYWSQSGASNVGAMLRLLADYRVVTTSSSSSSSSKEKPRLDTSALPALEITPDVGLIHPLRYQQIIIQSDNNRLSPYFASPAEYMKWRLSDATHQSAQQVGFSLADAASAPRVAVLLYRKHVITEQRYLQDLIRLMEKDGIIPVPIFINGVEAHTIVRDWLTSDSELQRVRDGHLQRPASYQAAQAVKVNAIVNTIGFPLVGGPAGSMQAGRNVAVAEELLSAMNVPYMVACPLLLQSIPLWKDKGVLGLQSVVIYSLPELDGAIDSIVLGGLVGDKIALVPERVRKMTGRIKKWTSLRSKPPSERRIAVSLYGFPPSVGAVGTAALLDVPKSLEALLQSLSRDGYDVGKWATDEHASGESIVAALTTLSEDFVINRGATNMQTALDAKIARATAGDNSVPASLGLPGGGLGGARVIGKNVNDDELEEMLGSYMMRRVRRAWASTDLGPGATESGYVVAGLQIGNICFFVQPLLGIEGDPMRLLFERDLTPHPQYCATYKWLQRSMEEGGFGSDAVIHMGMHGTVEWLPGQPLGNDRTSWSDDLIGNLPNLYVYAANNPSESILAKRRGYGTIVSHNVPPYGRAGLYLELANLKELVEEHRTEQQSGSASDELFDSIMELAERNGMLNDVPINLDDSDTDQVDHSEWIGRLTQYLSLLQDRLFSSGLHILGSRPTDDELVSYLGAYFGDKLSEDECSQAVSSWRDHDARPANSLGDRIAEFFQQFMGQASVSHETISGVKEEALELVSLLDKSTEEMSAILTGLDGGYIRAAPGGDLIRDGVGVLPTGRNTYALDPYRMPSAGAMLRGQKAAKEIIKQHLNGNDGAYPETVAVSLWGLDAIKTRGESVAIVLALVGAVPIKEGTGRIVRFDLVPLSELGRPRIDVLASMSGIFRDSFANVVDLLDDMFERASSAEENVEMNFIRKHAQELTESGVKERAAARLFSNPPGDYGSMVNEVVGNGDWDESESLGEVWRGRNVFSYGRGETQSTGVAQPEVLDKLLSTTTRVVQQIDSVEYGLSDIQEYYANTGALKKAAENRKELDETGEKPKKVQISIIEAFDSSADEDVPVKDLEEVLRLEYRSKLLNPRWRDAMLATGSGGAYEVSQRMTAMIGWAATASVDNFVFDQAAERFALDEAVALQLQKANPEAFKNIVRRLLEAAGRGLWSTDDDTLGKLKDLYADADDIIEQGSGATTTAES